MTTTSAPGKVVLSGEYAVLDGAPAIAMAVDRRASVTVTDASESTIECIGLDGNVDRSLLDCVERAIGMKAPPRALLLDTSAFVDTTSGDKLGIGSSAALAVALVRALLPESDDRVVAASAARAHREFQGQVGSGVDVATSVAGGLIEYTQDNACTRALQWPAELHYALLWSGVAASTRQRIERLAKAKSHSSREALQVAAGETSAAWRAGNATHIVAATEAFTRSLQNFDVDHALGIFEAGHEALFDASAKLPVAYKPCGAGGGDIGIVLGDTAQVVDDFVNLAQGFGFIRLDVRLDQDGMRIDA